MRIPHNVWKQLRNITADELISALHRDGWVRDERSGAVQVLLSPTGARIAIHYHPGKTYGAKLLRALLADIGWDVRDLKRLKLIK